MMKVSLRAGERIYINGAVLRVDRKVSIELVNDVMFLLEGQVMQACDATTAMRQLYFVVQLMLMNPTDVRDPMALYRPHHAALLALCENREMLDGLNAIDELGRLDPLFRGAQADQGVVSSGAGNSWRRHDRFPIRGCLTAERHMNVPSATETTSKTTSTGSPTAASSNSVDYNTFLQLLVAEMKNQDPTNPMDTSQYMSQFAQLSTVEQAMQTNTKLDALLSSQALSQADGLIGRTVSFTDSTGASFTGKIASVSINSDGSIATLENGTKVAIGPGLTLS
ncbi:flagellar biosynthesis regulator FlbT [Bradyrhizobium sp. LM2.7]